MHMHSSSYAHICEPFPRVAYTCTQVMGARVSIRSAVNINSPTMRAIKYILMEPGLTLGKVCILCGGPDWPTSVICGIIRRADPTLKDPAFTLQLLVGLTPMIFLVVPTVLASAFQLRTNDPGPYESIATVALVVCTALQFLAFIGILRIVGNVIQTKKAVLDSYPLDVEVEEFEKAQVAEVADPNPK